MHPSGAAFLSSAASFSAVGGRSIIASSSSSSSFSSGGGASAMQGQGQQESPESGRSGSPEESPESATSSIGNGNGGPQESPESSSSDTDGGTRKGHPLNPGSIRTHNVITHGSNHLISRAVTSGGTPRPHIHHTVGGSNTPRHGGGGGGGTPSIRAAGGFHLFPTSSSSSAGIDSPNVRINAAGWPTSARGQQRGGISSGFSCGRLVRRWLSTSLRLQVRFIGLFIVLTFLYSLAFISYCRAPTMGPFSDDAMAAQSAAADEFAQHMKLAHTPADQAHCKPCQECPVPAPLDTAMLAPAPTTEATCPPCPSSVVPGAASEKQSEATTTLDAGPVSSAIVHSESLLGSNPHPIDSSGTLYKVLGRGKDSRQGDEYVLCSFTRVCAQNDRLLFVHHDQAQVERWKEEWNNKCWKVPQWQQPSICACFHGNFRPDFLTTEQVAATEKDGAQIYTKQHYWSVHKWVPIHHIAHWAQKLLIWQSVYQHGSLLPLPPLDGLVFHDSDGPLSEHESVILAASLSALQPAHTHPIALASAEGEGRLAQRTLWAAQLASKQRSMETDWTAQDSAGSPRRTDSWKHLQCFERLSLVPHYGILSTHPDDTVRFRQAVYRKFGIAPEGGKARPEAAEGLGTDAAGGDSAAAMGLAAGATGAASLSSSFGSASIPVPALSSSSSRCPPHRALLLYRHNRGILNRDAIRSMMQSEFGISLEYGTVNEESSSLEQVELFSSTGLLLSSHSSQLINVLFSPPGGSLIEVAPEFYNADFAEYAHAMGAHFNYALGGEVPDGLPQPLQTDCVEHLAHCHGASFCVLKERYKCKNKQYPNKNRDFIANLTAVRIAVQNSVQHLNWLCGGRW